MNTISFTDENHMIKIMVGILRQLGYTIFEPCKEMVTQADLQKMFNQSAKNISYALRSPQCPKYMGVTSPSGQIKSVEMNPELHAWLTTRFNQPRPA